jgi:hypothetical protein
MVLDSVANFINVQASTGFEHPGARIFDLREAVWEIRTETHPTPWMLVSMPAPK